MSLLVVYYSYGGNTRRVAERVHAKLGGDIAEIRTVKPYTGSYDDVVEQGQEEVNAGFKPAIQPLGVNVADYDDIVIGTPPCGGIRLHRQQRPFWRTTIGPIKMFIPLRPTAAGWDTPRRTLNALRCVNEAAKNE